MKRASTQADAFSRHRRREETLCRMAAAIASASTVRMALPACARSADLPRLSRNVAVER